MIFKMQAIITSSNLVLPNYTKATCGLLNMLLKLPIKKNVVDFFYIFVEKFYLQIGDDAESPL